MLELADRLLPSLRRGERIALATSIDVIGSAPHLVGTSMAVTPTRVDGSVSNGCVEGAALAACREVLAGAAPSVRRYGFGDAEAALAGLACGGELDVLVHAIDEEALPAVRAAAEGREAWLGFVTAGPERLLGRIVTEATCGGIAGPAAGLLALEIAGVAGTGRPGTVAIDCEGVLLRVFVDVVAPARRMVVVGATDTAVALASAATQLGYAVTVCDPRADFAQPGRFPGATVTLGLPHEVLAAAALAPRDAVCLLSHDEDLDPLALAVALESAAGYVGALGSRGTAARRVERLLLLGVTPEAIGRLHAPVGLDLGASTPAEVAVSIVAEVLAVRASAPAVALREGAGPIHRERLRT